MSAASLVRRPAFVASTAIVAGWIVIAVVWRWLPVDPFGRSGAPLQPPSRQQWFGTDQFGRSVLDRVLAGSSSVLAAAPLASVLATVAGTTIGLLMAWYGGLVDELVMRLLDVYAAIPAIVLLVVVTAAFGRSVPTMMGSIAILFTPLVARTVRAAALVEVDKPYVAAARLGGEPAGYVLTREILPNVFPVVAVEATIRLGYAIFAAATLSYLGLGPQPPSPDWGLTVAANRPVLQFAWWTVVFPAAAIASLVIAVNLLADHLRERSDG